MTHTDLTIGLAPDAGREPTHKRTTRPPSASWTAERWARWMETVKAAQAATAPETASHNKEMTNT